MLYKLFITGGSGFLGSRLVSFLSPKYKVISSYNGSPHKHFVYLDITKRRDVFELIKKIKPDVVIHTSAIADIDKCELYQKKAMSINYNGTKNVADACRKYHIKLIFTSSVYVFDGKKGNYCEGDKTHPLNCYGKTKLLAEKEVQKLQQYVILRQDIIYGFSGLNFPNGLFGKIMTINKPTKVDSRQIKQPVFVDDVARVIDHLISSNFIGIIHIAGPDRLTKYELCSKLEKLIRKKSFLIPAKRLIRLGKRPVDTTMNTKLLFSIGLKFTPLNKAILSIKRDLKTQT